MTKNLGRGLSALLGEAEEPETTTQGVKVVALSDLEPSPFQPRRVFDEDAIHDLVESIKNKGVIQPLIVRQKHGESDKYEIIGGERRWRASQSAGLTEVPVLVKNFSDKEALEVALIENLQRQDLNALEEAEGYRRLMEEFSNTQEELARAVGKSRSHVANTMRLLALPQPVKTMLEKGKLTSGHARALLTSKDPEALANAVVSRGLNVRQTEKLAQEGVKPRPAPAKKEDKKSEWDDVAQDLSRALGLAVSIRPKARGGELVLSYSTLEELDRLISRLSRKPTSSSDEISAAVTEDVIQMENDEIGEVIFDDSFDEDADIISLDSDEE